MSLENFPGFNKEHYADAIDYINHHAAPYGLQIEVQNTFKYFLKCAFALNGHSLNYGDYMDMANDALYEWGI